MNSKGRRRMVLVAALLAGGTAISTGQQAHAATKKPKVLMDIKGKGYAFNPLLAFAFDTNGDASAEWTNPKKTFLAPAHFKVQYRYSCSSDQADLELDIFSNVNGAVHGQQIANSIDSGNASHGTTFVDSTTTGRYAFSVMGMKEAADCTWHLTAMRLH